MKQKNPDGYILPAVIEKYGNAWSVGFLDLPGCVATGSNFEDAIKNAKEAAGLHLWGIEEDGESVSAKAMQDNWRLQKGQSICFIEIPRMCK